MLRFVLALTAAFALATTSHAASETFVWLPNSEPDAAGYRIYYGSPPGEYSQIADVGNVTRATIDGLTPGATYRFYATCYNTAGLESDPSDTVELVIPTDPTENRPPVALGTTVTAVSGEVTTITLEAEDPDGDPLSFNLASFPMHGEIIDYPIANGHRATLTYQSPPGYTGTDEFLFTVNDGWFDSTPATVTIQVLAVNLPPVALAQSVSTPGNTPVTVVLHGTDPDNDPLTFAVTTPPENGVLSGTAPTLTYTPNAGYAGNDTFEFTASDGQETSIHATVTIQVLAVNLPPAALAQSVATPGNTPVTIVLHGTDPDNDPLTFAVTTPPENGVLSGTAPTLTYTPNAGYAGDDTFEFTASDGQETSIPATVTIQVLAIDTAPILTALQLRGDWGVGLRWSALPGREYQVAYCDSLDTTHWLLLPDVFLASLDQIEIEIELEHPLPSMPGQRFYRVLLLPAETGN